jgi:hypothetical protein
MNEEAHSSLLEALVDVPSDLGILHLSVDEFTPFAEDVLF